MREPKELYEDLENINSKKREIESFEKDLDKLKSTLISNTFYYRNKSVARVLNHINNKCWTNKVDMKEFQNLIVHCINKLNGNIDGVEIPLGLEVNE